MKKLEELTKEKRDYKLEQRKDRYIRTGIIQAYLDENPHDLSIYRCFNYQRELTSVICDEHYWEPIATGFVYRDNFKYDPVNFEITFDSHRIQKAKDGWYTPDLSEVSRSYFNEHFGDFTALSKADEIIAKYHSKYQKRVDKGLDIAMEFFNTFRPDLLDQQIHLANSQNEMFLLYYGEVGINLLVKWLNRLNDDIYIENLITEFKMDIKLAKTHMETLDNHYYNNIKSVPIEFENRLLRMIERYSPRGKYFRACLNKIYNEVQEKKKYNH